MPSKVPDGLESLDAALHGLGSTEDDYVANRAIVANSIVCSLMSDGVVRGGFAMVLCYGAAATRVTSGLDVIRRCAPDEFSHSLSEAPEGGWEGFTFDVAEKPNKQLPDGTPEAYTTQNFDVSLSFLGTPWFTVEVEAGYNEFADVRGPDFIEAGDANRLLTAMGFPELGTDATLRVDQQIAQKLIV